MTTSSKVSTTAEPELTDRVRSFFDQPENYLDRKRFDIRLRTETTQFFLKGKTFQKIIDIGCGDGSVSLPLLSERTQLTLVDLSPNMLSLARSRVPANLSDNVKFFQEDFVKLPLEENSFDVVICMGVLAHVASPTEVIQKAAALLKPGGTLVLECTDSFHFVRRLMTAHSRLLELFRPTGYKLTKLSGAEVVAIAEKAGLKLTGKFRYAWPAPGLQRVFSQDTLYRMVRRVFGSAQHNQNAGLGFEHIFCLTRR